VKPVCKRFWVSNWRLSDYPASEHKQIQSKNWGFTFREKGVMIAKVTLVAAPIVGDNSFAASALPAPLLLSGDIGQVSPIHRKTARTTQFATRVQVWANGAYLYRVHGERADYLVHSGTASIGEGDRHAKRVWRIHLVAIAATAAQRKGAPKPAHPRHFATAAAVFMQVLGYSAEKRLATYTFKKISKLDALRIAAERNDLRRKR
jgi:hypothetical protein